MDAIREMMAGILEAGTVSLNFASNGLGVLVYILNAWALYTIAKRREIKKPWLAWIPVVNVWILGSVSDQYQYVVNRKVKNKRKVLLGLNIAQIALCAILLIWAIWVLIDVLMLSFGALSNFQLTDAMIYTLLQEHLMTILMLALLSIPAAVLAVVYTVYFYMALYDVFRSSDPGNSTMYLVLSLVGNVVVEGAYCIFTMLCKEKDLGMPPRKKATEEPLDEEPENTEV
ncbi:MAG: hypothetical protein E7447_02970 [Ruminococcaceae bacterium]|nr:hypothetical protein [Oscillospiraceae bacterium]